MMSRNRQLYLEVKSVNQAFGFVSQRRVDRYLPPPANVAESDTIYICSNSPSTYVVSPPGDNNNISYVEGLMNDY